jgi:MFS transporter, ACS family, hexuronate transporter
MNGSSNNKIGNYRWVVCALLFLATTINYLDRQVIGLLKDTLATEFSWSEKDYSNIVMAFTSVYALSLLLSGRLIDRIGSKAGYAWSVLIWSISAASHALVRTTFGFGMARAALGLGEGGNFPAAIRSVAEWFPKKERALATGIFNSGTNIAAVIGPLAIAWIYTTFGWRQAFLWTGLLGFVWLIFWQIYYELPLKQKRVSEAERNYILSDSTETVITQEPAGWRELFSSRPTWAFFIGKFITDPVWYFYIFWIPSYFNTTFGMNLATSAVPISMVYLASGFGSISGGAISSWLIRKKEWIPFRARKFTMLFFALLVIPVIGVRFTTDIWSAVALISLAAAAHQAWSANLYTTVSDSLPNRMVSSAIGFGGMAGSVGGILFPLTIGILLDYYKSVGHLKSGYNILFIFCGLAYVIAWTIMSWLNSRKK